MVRPDGMATMAQERKHMKEMRQFEPTFTHELIALDSDGGELYRTGAYHSEEEAQSDIAAMDESDFERLDDAVDSFEVGEYSHD